MKITVYTINDCKFSQAEKEYLKKNNMEFEEKNLETNRDFLTEMLAISNNFAGTPVTQIEKDTGEKIVLKGFTTEEFDKALGIATEAAAQPANTDAQPAEKEMVPPVEENSPEPVVVEALSQDGTNDVTMPAPQAQPEVSAAETVMPPSMPEPSQPVAPTPPVESAPAVEPMAPPMPPTPQDTIGPISLDVTESSAPQAQPEVSAAETVMPPSMPEPSQPVAPAQAQMPQQDGQAQPAQADPLNSVLQNLQTQVDQASPKKEENQPPQQ